MEHRRIGSFEVSVAGLGCNNFGNACDEGQTQDVVSAALDSGVNLFDTADVYSYGRSEEFLGKALRSVRDEVVIASKFGHPMMTYDDKQLSSVEGSGGGGTGWIIKAAEDSLVRLGTDRIDLYQMHVPDETTPIEETLTALNKLIADGKVLEIGCSNFTASQLNESVEVASEAGLRGFVSAQNHYNLLTRGAESDILTACDHHEIGFLPYFPLASGLLTGKYTRDDIPKGTRLGDATEERRKRWLNDENFEIVERLAAFAARSGKPIIELAMSWLAGNPKVSSVISGATRAEQVRINARSVDWDLTAEELLEISEITASAVGRS